MADSVTLDAMTGGDTIAADDISGAKYQRIKLVHGADGVNAGDVSTANGFPVQVVSALPAGTNNIGDVDVLSIVPGTGATNLGKAEDSAHTSGDTGVMALGVANVAQSSLAADGDYIPLATDTKGNVLTTGNIAHDGVDAGNPGLTGYRAIAHGTNPTAVAAADRTVAYSNRHGIPFIIGGHPNVLTAGLNVTDADGAQTNTAIITVSSGLKIVVTHIQAIADKANSGTSVQCRVGFGASATPAEDAAGQVLNHPGIPPGGGAVVGNGAGIIGIGGDGDDLRLTCADPAGGSISINVGYYTIES